MLGSHAQLPGKHLPGKGARSSRRPHAFPVSGKHLNCSRHCSRLSIVQASRLLGELQEELLTGTLLDKVRTSSFKLSRFKSFQRACQHYTTVSTIEEQ